MTTKWAGWIVAALALAALAAGAVYAASYSAEVRITARQAEDGRIEFALQQKVDGEWGERILPASRFFPADVGHNRWLNSTPITVSVAAEQSAQPRARESNCGSETLAILPDAVCTASFPTPDGGVAAHYAALGAGRWAANAHGRASEYVYECQLFARSVDGSGFVTLNVQELHTEQEASTFFNIGYGVRDDLTPGLVEVRNLGCADWLVTFAPR